MTIILAIGGVLGVLSQEKKALRVASIMLGVGMGLFADEIGLLLNCTTTYRQCTYAFPDILDIISTIAVVLLLLIVLVDLSERFYFSKKISKDSTGIKKL